MSGQQLGHRRLRGWGLRGPRQPQVGGAAHAEAKQGRYQGPPRRFFVRPGCPGFKTCASADQARHGRIGAATKALRRADRRRRLTAAHALRASRGRGDQRGIVLAGATSSCRGQIIAFTGLLHGRQNPSWHGGRPVSCQLASLLAAGRREVRRALVTIQYRRSGSRLKCCCHCRSVGAHQRLAAYSFGSW